MKTLLPRMVLWIVTGLTGALQSVPAAAQTLTITPYNALGASASPITPATTTKAPSTSAVRKARANSYQRQLLLPTKPTITAEQAIEQGFVTALSHQLANQYPALTIPSSIPNDVIHGGRQRKIYHVKGLLDLPRYVKPGSALVFTFENLNWLKYTAEVDGKAYERQFSLATDFEKPPVDGPPPASSAPAAPALNKTEYTPSKIKERALKLLMLRGKS